MALYCIFAAVEDVVVGGFEGVLAVSAVWAVGSLDSVEVFVGWDVTCSEMRKFVCLRFRQCVGARLAGDNTLLAL